MILEQCCLGGFKNKTNIEYFFNKKQYVIANNIYNLCKNTSKGSGSDPFLSYSILHGRVGRFFVLKFSILAVSDYDMFD